MFVENFTFSQALQSVRIAGLFCQRITQITLIFLFLSPDEPDEPDFFLLTTNGTNITND